MDRFIFKCINEECGKEEYISNHKWHSCPKCGQVGKLIYIQDTIN